ncbi:MAG: transglycosylase SLT domain-containing protein [Thermoanaerobaculia bacterium]
MIRRSLALALLFVARTAAGDFSSPPSPDAEDLFARGAEALDRGDGEAAASAFAEIRSKYPLPAWDERIDFLLARKPLDSGMPKRAVDLLTRLDVRAIGLEEYRDYFLGSADLRAGMAAEARAAFVRCARGISARQADAALAVAASSRSRAGKLEALDLLGRASAAREPGRIDELLAARARLARELGDDGALARTASDLLRLRPSALFDRNSPRLLQREARRELARLPDSRRLEIAQKVAEAGESSGALALSEGVAIGGLSPVEQRRFHLLRARVMSRLGKLDSSDREAGRVAPGPPAEEKGAALVLAQNSLRRTLAGRGRRRNRAVRDLAPAEARRLALEFHAASGGESPEDVRERALRSEIALWVAAGDRDAAMESAARLTASNPAATWGFDALWAPTWEKVEAGDWGGALLEIERLASIYREISVSRRLQYWKARCFQRLGRAPEARASGRYLPCADPPDLYAQFASEWKSPCANRAPVDEPERSALFVRVDELLRQRLFSDALWEVDHLEGSRGATLRRAVASFALGDFATATAQVKSAFPEMGTAREGDVPEQWRRLYYPIDRGGLIDSAAREFGVDRNLLLAVVRQESAFNPKARSRAGAAGLAQLMPSTARRLSRKVLKRRFRSAFLYDPAVNVRLGASYLRSLVDLFHGNVLLAVAAYNAGPGRIGGIVRANPGSPPDERLESFPAAETRDYVRHVMLYSESYKELYPQ